VQVVCDPCIEMLFCGEALKDVDVFQDLSASAAMPSRSPQEEGEIRLARRAIALSKREKSAFAKAPARQPSPFGWHAEP
jgi:hypothetical protein